MYKGGYTAKILRIDPIDHSAVEEEVFHELVKNNLGRVGFTCQNAADLVNVTAGYDSTPEGIEKIGERIDNLARIFNTRMGFTRRDDMFPNRLKIEAIKYVSSSEQPISQTHLDTMLAKYCEVPDSDKDGNPGKAKLKNLGIKT